MNRISNRIVVTIIIIALLLTTMYSGGVVASAVEIDSSEYRLAVGESYTFDFDNVTETIVGTTALVDGEGNTFYPIHSNNPGATVSGADIEVIKTDGSTQKASALKIESGGKSSNWYANKNVSYIPTDKNGKPFIIDPNSTYSVTAEVYYSRVGDTGTRLSFGGGDFRSDDIKSYGIEAYGDYAYYYVDGTDKGVAVSNKLTTGTTMFRAIESTYFSTCDFADFSQKDKNQYKSLSGNMSTSDFKANNNIFKTALKDKNGTTQNKNVGTYFTVALQSYDCVVYVDKITITKTGQTATITYDANGGYFDDNTATKTIKENVGEELSIGVPTHIDADKTFKGWSLSADSKTTIKNVDASLHGKTVYAVWSEPELHPSDGVYDTWTRMVEFENNRDDIKDSDEYVLRPDKNIFVNPNTGIPYFSIIPDEDGSDDNYLHYVNHSKASNWYPNWNITPTYNGVSGTNQGTEDYNILPTATTFKVTARIRINDDDGSAAFWTYYYGSGDGVHSSVDAEASPLYNLETGLTETEGFVVLEAYFTTPSAYEVEADGKISNRFYIGFRAPGYALDYDLDYIKIEKATNTTLYIKEGSEYVIHNTITGVPGTNLNIPAYYSEERYSDYDPTGSETGIYFGEWYADKDCITVPIMKFGNMDTVLYCDKVTAIPSVSTDNQEMFVGFDKYTERTGGLINAAITDTDYNSGQKSLKAELAADKTAVFELKNDKVLDVVDGKTYRIDFVYKSDKAVKVGVGFANGNVANGVAVNNEKTLPASANWQSASITLTAEDVQNSTVLAATLSADSQTVVYLDTIIVSSATESVGVERETTDQGESLRFMFMYTNTADNKLIMAGNEFEVVEHGVLIKSEETSVKLSLENKDKNGIFHFAQTDLSKNWSVNPITGDTVYSALLNGFDPADDYKVTLRGYVKMSDGNVYYTDLITASVDDIPTIADVIPENADLTNYYVYLPKGTAFPQNRTYSVRTYDELFEEVSAVSENTMTSGAYVSFSAKPNFSEIKVPSELKYLVHAGKKEELYFSLDAQIASKNINSVGAEGVNYLYVTDLHYGSDLTSAQNRSVLSQAELMVKMANENDNIDFVVVGGDTTTGMYRSKSEAIKWTQAALDPFLKCTKPVFVLMGNHDDNSYHLYFSENTSKEIYEDCLITDLDWQKNIIDRYTNRNGITVSQDTKGHANSKYYYYDLVGKKTRIIALDSLDYEAKYDENGYVLGDNNGDGLLDGMPIKNPSAATDMDKYYHGCNYWGYSADQVRWLAEDALGTLPAEYDVIFVSHMGIDKNTNSHGNKIWYSENVRDVLNAFTNGNSYNVNITGVWGDTVSVSADFGTKNGNLISWQFGHQHMELSYFESDLNLWQICTPSANVGQSGNQTEAQILGSNLNNKGLPWRAYARKLGAETEVCFNLISVSSDRIYRFSVGQGANEKLIYPN